MWNQVLVRSQLKRGVVIKVDFTNKHGQCSDIMFIEKTIYS